ncbi:response regulator [Steroidobacter sp.]|uniref:response regulator n=1 Tax=Steroidobacter sp. TaxID=1978227 RepID=UPI001A47B839|nr:response regulator [Steroidobacter sp.]MBL8271408.1 response regulator [Steroidobacter sp.]
MLVKRIRKWYETTQFLREHSWLGYAFALLTSVAAMYVRVLLSGVLEGFPFITFFVAIVLTAFIFGWRAGALAAVLGAIISSYFLLPADWSLAASGLSNWIGLGFYVTLVSVILVLTAAMHRGFAEYAQDDEQRRIANDLLESRVAERTAELQAANQKLRDEVQSRATAEAQVRQMQKMEAVGQLTGGIAHDFNNMLAIIVGSLDMAKKYAQRDPAKASTSIDHAMEGAKRAAELTARLLAFSRLQPLDPRPVDANKLVSGMSELLTRALGGNVRLETVLAGGLWRMFADPPQLESAILNLCVNGRHAMAEGGKITLETMNAHLDDTYAANHAEVRPGQYVAIAVTDSGSGMSAEVMSRAFDPFFTTKKPGQGTGLGLSQVYGFAKQSGGHVKLYSEVGQGTTVKLYLPRYTGEDETVAAPLPADRPLRGNTSEVILVVEDEDRVRQMSVQLLQDLGYTVVQASDAKHALAMIEANTAFDLLFTDVVMPDMNGKQLADRIKERRPDVKVLYTTGYTRNAVIHNGMLDRDVSFLPKPFTIQQLATKVRQVLDQK